LQTTSVAFGPFPIIPIIWAIIQSASVVEVVGVTTAAAVTTVVVVKTHDAAEEGKFNNISVPAVNGNSIMPLSAQIYIAKQQKIDAAAATSGQGTIAGGVGAQAGRAFAKGSQNEKTNTAAKTGQEAHRQIQSELKKEGVKTEQKVELQNGQTVRKDGVRPDGTTIIIKPDTKTGREAAARREKLMKDNGHKTEVHSCR
jgi:hypothetical protein